jgi:hypothetical protein
MKQPLDSPSRAGSPIGRRRLAAPPPDGVPRRSGLGQGDGHGPQPEASGPRFPPVRVAHATHQVVQGTY